MGSWWRRQSRRTSRVCSKCRHDTADARLPVRAMTGPPTSQQFARFGEACWQRRFPVKGVQVCHLALQQLHIAQSRAAAEAVLKQCSASPGPSAHSSARPPDWLVCGGEGLSCLQVCTHCGTNWNRDVNAARNMADVVTALVEGLQLNEAFQRPAAGTKRPRQRSRRPPSFLLCPERRRN